MAQTTVTQNGQTITYDPTTQQLVTDPTTGLLMRVALGGAVDPTAAASIASMGIFINPPQSINNTIVSNPGGVLGTSLYQSLAEYLGQELQSEEVTGAYTDPTTFRNQLIADAWQQCQLLGGNDPNCADNGYQLANQYADSYEAYVAANPVSPTTAGFTNPPPSNTALLTSAGDVPATPSTPVVSSTTVSTAVSTPNGGAITTAPSSSQATPNTAVVNSSSDSTLFNPITDIQDFISSLTPTEMLIGAAVLGLVGLMMVSGNGGRR